MRLLEGIEVACFDLFDTLIRIDTSRLPAVEWEGRSLRSSIPIVHARHFAGRGGGCSEQGEQRGNDVEPGRVAQVERAESGLELEPHVSRLVFARGAAG